MPKQVRLRRGTTTQHSTFTGAEGEVTFDTTKKCLVAHDGVTPGGNALTDWVAKNVASPSTTQEINSALYLSGGTPDGETLGLWVEHEANFQAHVSIVGELSVRRLGLGATTLAYGATVAIDFAGAALLETLSLTGDVVFTSANLGQGWYRLLRVKADASPRNLTWPSGWRWIGSGAPASLAANKMAMLHLWSMFNSDAEVVAQWIVEP